MYTIVLVLLELQQYIKHEIIFFTKFQYVKTQGNIFKGNRVNQHTSDGVSMDYVLLHQEFQSCL